MAKKDRNQRDVRGILLLDKPAGMTSNRALQRVKRLYGAAKAGHTGSLDPLATGMLPICLGGATKLAQFLLDAPKTYRVVSRLGEATVTADADGEIIARSSIAPDLERMRAALARHEGEVEQVPPMYSALKHEGRRLYELARRGVEVERKPRPVTIYSIELESYRWPELVFSVRCSKGTYVRTLVTDIAAAAGTLGHVSALRRVALGPFEAGRMRTLDELEARAEQAGAEALDEWLLPPDTALLDWPSVMLSNAAAGRLGRGQSVALQAAAPCGRVRVYGPGKKLIGIGEVLPGGELVPRRML